MDAVGRFCAEQITPERLTTWEREPRGIDDRGWQSIADLGWFGLGIPESVGGSGLGLVEVGCLLHECGRGLIPPAVISAIRGGWALAGLHPHADELREVAAGRAAVALALDEEDARRPEHYGTRAEGNGDSVRIVGAKSYVVAGGYADWYVVAARERDGVSLFLVGRDGVEARPLRGFDGTEQAVLTFAATPARRRLSEPGLGADALRRLVEEQTALALAEMVGGMKAVIDATVAYVKEREQFGQKIAVFQAVQHQVADMATAYTSSRHLAWQAMARLAAGTRQGTELETAAAFVGRAFKRITWTGHHLHGGAGYIVEHPLHYHSERAQALCVRYTPEAEALEAVASALLDG